MKDTFGGEVTQLQFDPARVLPNSEREFQATWDTGWNIGRFKAEYLGFYGADNKQVTASVTFIIFPWQIAGPVLIVLLLIVLVFVRGRRRLARTFRVLFGSE